MEQFGAAYAHLKLPTELNKEDSLMLFRAGVKPMWEEFPEGGLWIVRIRRRHGSTLADQMWEDLLLACVGEQFGSTDVVGCVFSRRSKDDVISVGEFE